MNQINKRIKLIFNKNLEKINFHPKLRITRAMTQTIRENVHYQMKKKKINSKKSLNTILMKLRIKGIFYGKINQLKIYPKKSKFGTK